MDGKLEEKLNKAFEEANWSGMTTEDMLMATTTTLETLASHLEETEPSATGSIQILHDASCEVQSHLSQ